VLVSQIHKLAGAVLFLSASTDPYQPVEREYGITRTLLRLLLTHQVDFKWLLISTRSPLILRDVDLLLQLRDRLEVGISQPTDREDLRRLIDPKNPPVAARFNTARVFRQAGIPVRLHISPMLPYSPDFPQKAGEVADWVWLDWFGHKRLGWEQPLKELGFGEWTKRQFIEHKAKEFAQVLGQGRVGVGRDWFAARWDGTQAVRWLGSDTPPREPPTAQGKRVCTCRHEEQMGGKEQVLQIRDVPIGCITVDSYNLRGKIEVESRGLKRLATSIREDGLLQPLGGIEEEDGTVTLVYGHRRYWAIKHYLADVLPTVPVRLIPKAEAEGLKATRKAIAENELRQKLNPITLAQELRKLRDSGLSNREIADDLGYVRAGSVTAVLKLLELEPEAQEALYAGRLSFGYGKALESLIGKRQDQLQALKEIEALEEQTVRKAEAIVEAIKTGGSWFELTLELPESAKLSVSAKGRHKLTIEFEKFTKLREDLTYIVERNVDPPLHYKRINGHPHEQEVRDQQQG
jgi:ParB/RepB/Spo0J family partition protein